MRALSSNSFFTPSAGVRGLPGDKTCWNEVAPYKLHLRDAENGGRMPSEIRRPFPQANHRPQRIRSDGEN